MAVIAMPSRFLTLNKVTFLLQNQAQRGQVIITRAETAGSQGEPLDVAGLLEGRASVPQKGESWTPDWKGRGRGAGVPGKRLTPQGPTAHRPPPRVPAARSPALPCATGCRLVREVPAPWLPEAPRPQPSRPHQPLSCPRPPARP